MLHHESKFFDLAQEFLAVCKTDGTILRANRAWETKAGFDHQKMIGQSIMNYLKDEHWSEFSRTPSAVGLIPVNGNMLVCNLAIERDPENDLAYVSALPQQELSEESADRWIRAIEGTDAGFWDIDSSRRLYFSARYYTMLGYEPNEFSPTTEAWIDRLHPDDRPSTVAYLARFRDGREKNFRREYRLRTKDGSYRWIHTVATATRLDDGSILQATGWNFDVTDRVEALERLKISEERSRSLLASLPDVIMRIDHDGRYIEVHANGWPHMLHKSEDMVGRLISDFTDPERANRYLSAIRDAIDFGVCTAVDDAFEVRGKMVHMESRVSPGGVGVALLILRDVTENREAMIARRDVEERLRALSRHVPGMIFQFQSWKDGRSSFPFANDKAFEVLGVSPEELRNRGYDGVNPPFVHTEDDAGLRAAFREAVKANTSATWEGRVFVASGLCKWIRILASPRKQPDGSVIWNGLALDVTEENTLRRQLQEQQAMMSSSSRLAALGEMAGGIAHEINNPLTVAHAYASRLRDLAHEGRVDNHAVDVSAEKIENVCMRISRIIAGLRTLARDGAEDFFVNAKVNTLVADALALCSEKLKHMQIELVFEPARDSLSIECRPVQISQVLVNLLSNSQHAVEARAGARWIRIAVVEHEDEVELRVSDSGAGVAPHLRGRIFDPFFTTKDVGKGTGLGLSVSASIARSHAGKLMLDSESPHTTFVLKLPKSQPPLDESVP